MQLLDLVTIARVKNRCFCDIREHDKIMISESYIAKSGQLWKFWVSFFLLLVGFAAFILAFTPSIQTNETVGVTLILLGIGFSVLGFLWVCFSIKCGMCKSYIVWNAMKTQSSQNWLNLVLTSKVCLICKEGYKNEK